MSGAPRVLSRWNLDTDFSMCQQGRDSLHPVAEINLEILGNEDIERLLRVAATEIDTLLTCFPKLNIAIDDWRDYTRTYLASFVDDPEADRPNPFDTRILCEQAGWVFGNRYPDEAVEAYRLNAGGMQNDRGREIESVIYSPNILLAAGFNYDWYNNNNIKALDRVVEGRGQGFDVRSAIAEIWRCRKLESIVLITDGLFSLDRYFNYLSWCSGFIWEHGGRQMVAIREG